jgi:HK97 family phage prohead protease
MASEVAKLIEARVLKAVSVGFAPGEWKWRDKRGEGIDFVSGHQLLEASVVNVPANPDALLDASLLDLRSFEAAKRQRTLELIKLKAWV